MSEQALSDRIDQNCQAALDGLLELIRSRKGYELGDNERWWAKIGIQAGYKIGFEDAMSDAKQMMDKNFRGLIGDMP